MKDLENTCFRPKNDQERSKNADEIGKSLNSSLIIANSDLNEQHNVVKELKIRSNWYV